MTRPDGMGWTRCWWNSVIRVVEQTTTRCRFAERRRGLMQLIPANGARFGRDQLVRREREHRGGRHLLKYLLDMFGDDRLAVAAYNAGESAVMRYGDVPPLPRNDELRIARRQGVGRGAPADARADGGDRSGAGARRVGARAVEAYVDSQGRICMRTR